MKDETMMSLYEYRGYRATNEEGKKVYAKAKEQGVKAGNRKLDFEKHKGSVLTYPKWFLEEYFHKVDPKDSIIDADDDELFNELPF